MYKLADPYWLWRVTYNRCGDRVSDCVLVDAFSCEVDRSWSLLEIVWWRAGSIRHIEWCYGRAEVRKKVSELRDLRVAPRRVG